MSLKNSSLLLPRRANAGLNFYVSVAVLAGPTQLSVLAALFPDHVYASTMIIAASWISLFCAPIFTQFAFKKGIKALLDGYLLRALLTLILVLFITFLSNKLYVSMIEFCTYLLFFFLLNLCHKVYFNVGWLHIMSAVTPKQSANTFVADVRRTNGIVTSVLSIGTLIILQTNSEALFLFYVWVVALGYALWSFWQIRSRITEDEALQDCLVGSLKREASRYSMIVLLRELGEKRTWHWLWPAIFPTFLIPPVLFLYAVQILALEWQHVLFVLLGSQLISSYLLPKFVALFNKVSVTKMRAILFFLAVVNLVIMVGNKWFETSNFIALGLIAINAILASSIGHTLGIVVHNHVIRIGVSKSESPRTFVIYNFALDVVPGFWMILGSLTIALSDVDAWFNYYEYLCLFGLAVFSTTLFPKKLTQAIGN